MGAYLAAFNSFFFYEGGGGGGAPRVNFALDNEEVEVEDDFRLGGRDGGFSILTEVRFFFND